MLEPEIMPKIPQGGHPNIERTYPSRPPRTRTCLAGTLVYKDGAFTSACTIRNISAGGAQVMLAKGATLPLNVYLIVVNHCVVHEARIVWRNHPAWGMKFVNTYEIGGEMSHNLQYLRKLWGDLYARSGWL